MPKSAIQNVNVDYIVALSKLAPLLVRLTSVGVDTAQAAPVPEQLDVEVEIVKEKNPLDGGLERVSKPSSFACPECHGMLLQLEEGGRIRFRCHTGHAYSVESLLFEIGTGMEDALWDHDSRPRRRQHADASDGEASR